MRRSATAIKTLVQAGADLQAIIGPVHTALHLAVNAGEQSAVRALSAVGADLNAQDFTGYTPLHLAVIKEQPAIIRVLARAGAKLEMRAHHGEGTSNGATALQLAVRYKCFECVVALVEEGADIDTLLCLGAYLFGVNFGQTAVLPPPRRPQGLSSGPSRSLLGAETDEVERRWTDKLIGDLQSSASDETVSATLSELRETLSAREERLQQLGAAARRTPAASGAGPAPAAASAASSVTVPRYDRNSVAELQQAAMAAALPSEVRGPLPQLVRDLGAALARQQTEHEALKKKLLQLQPAVINYDKTSTEQLTKAVLQATAGTSGAPDGGGALPRLLKDLAAQLASQEEGQEKQKKALELETTKKMRTARRAAALKALLLKTSPKVEERAALLFDELADRTTLAIEDATKGFEQPEGKSSSWSSDEKKEEAARWQDSLSEVRALVLDEFKAAAERNASLGLAYEEERSKRLALEVNPEAEEATAGSAVPGAAVAAADNTTQP
ncbi:MHC I C-terminus family protein [Chrysochromulina tobinii]|uniref:MHC I C-terminus family protein n=1 Tax=Chrysochromulina tobinii TaxID=1460289 RepID=A0A0M0JSV3_9EUKA|nr:MHC I C-terminus family protein [Chrysochromulina tobinii]|eukprot:KOO29570.1 MHC I C-terminus family protein [Chrysochromulina sp. CCMP291]